MRSAGPRCAHLRTPCARARRRSFAELDGTIEANAAYLEPGAHRPGGT